MTKVCAGLSNRQRVSVVESIRLFYNGSAVCVIVYKAMAEGISKGYNPGAPYFLAKQFSTACMNISIQPLSITEKFKF